MRMTVLGSGQDGGLPQVASTHANDRAARDGTITERTGPSLLVEEHGSSLVCDVSPDFRLQWWGRTALPDAVALTHAHIGHYAGLVHFGTEVAAARGVALHATPSMQAFLSRHAPWADLLDGGRLTPTIDGIWAGRRVELLPVPHRAEHTDTVAISIGGEVLWLPDIDAWEAWPQAADVISSHRIAFLDGSFWAEDEVPGRTITDIPHPTIPETIRLFGGSPARIVLVHLNHSNPACDPTSREAGEITAAGLEVAVDGMTVDL